MNCTDCGQPLPDEVRVSFPTLCDNCVRDQAAWFWELWEQEQARKIRIREDEAAGAQPPA